MEVEGARHSAKNSACISAPDSQRQKDRGRLNAPRRKRKTTCCGSCWWAGRCKHQQGKVDMRPCKKCGGTERYESGNCKRCSNAATALYDLKNRDKANQRNKKWRDKNPGVFLIHTANRRAKKLANGGLLSKGIRNRLFNLQKGKCVCCGEPLGSDYHMDHIMPLALGGVNEDWNMQLLKQQCNNQKKAKHPVEFMQSRGFLL